MTGLIKQKRCVQKLSQYPFISPSKLEFFKSLYNQKKEKTGIKELPVDYDP